MKNELNSLDMNDIKNLDWVNAKESKLKKYRHYLKEYNLLTEEKKVKNQDLTIRQILVFN